MKKKNYSKEIKEKAMIRILKKEETLSDISRDTGISIHTLYRWRDAKPETTPTKRNLNAEKWSSQDKFMVVLETTNLNEAELSKYCRKKGLYPEQVKQWEETCKEANGGATEETNFLSKELRKEKNEKAKLEKELRRKEKALAETAALLVLRKKANAIWGTKEEED